MSICIKESMRRDLLFLQTASKDEFKSINYQEVGEILKRRSEYKQELSDEELKSLYFRLKFEVLSLCESKLPFRIVRLVRRLIKAKSSLPSQLSEKWGQFLCPRSDEGLTSGLLRIQNTLLEKACAHENALRILESICWLHGSNSAILPMLKLTDHTLISTGALLDLGIAPMCGELNRGGMIANGINQHWISVETIRNLSRPWEYANKVSYSFHPNQFEEGEPLFLKCLQQLENLSSGDDVWDSYIVTLLQLKQWNSTLFLSLQEKYKNKIENLFQKVGAALFPKESMILQAIEYPDIQKVLEDVSAKQEVEAIFPVLLSYYPKWLEHCRWTNPFRRFLDEEIFSNHLFFSQWKDILLDVMEIRLHAEEKIKEQQSRPLSRERFQKNFGECFIEGQFNCDLFLQKFVKEKIEKRMIAKSVSSEKRLVRLKKALLENPCFDLLEEEKEMITHPFPILIGSTRSRAFFVAGLREANVPSAKWGQEIDQVFVKENDLAKMREWLRGNQLDEKVKVHSINKIAPLFPPSTCIPLYHSSKDVIGENPVFSLEQYQFINTHIQHLIPLYQAPYPDGSHRKYHGVVHGIRAALFSIVLIEMRLAMQEKLSVPIEYLPLTAFLHDTGRQSDYGEDLWDRESGSICQQEMEKLTISLEMAQRLSDSITRKEENPSISLEQEIIHDADCIEIIRCFIENVDAFERERLFLFQNHFPKALLDLFIEEAIDLIRLTEEAQIKEFLTQSSDPFRALVQIIECSQRFSFLLTTMRDVQNALCLTSNYVLAPTIEKRIIEFFAKDNKKTVYLP